MGDSSTSRQEWTRRDTRLAFGCEGYEGLDYDLAVFHHERVRGQRDELPGAPNKEGDLPIDILSSGVSVPTKAGEPITDSGAAPERAFLGKQHGIVREVRHDPVCVLAADRLHVAAESGLGLFRCCCTHAAPLPLSS